MSEISPSGSDELGVETFGYNQELKRVLDLKALIILGLSRG
ncbi:MAG TPA: hypothetical protein VMX95_06525 [Thermodesulfobacteriota bacterium]|nr:hypothetical protein [Thermodesulfobacteriota bacterium]